MKKKSLFILIAVIAIALVAWVGCTTKEEVKEPTDVDQMALINEVSAKWAGSAHADAASEAFNHWNEDDPAEVPVACAKCHSSTGFQDYIGNDGSAAGVVDAPGKIIDSITCATCHNDAADNLTSVTLPNGKEFTDLGNSAICMTCHSGMGSSAAVDAAITSASVGEDDVIEGQALLGVHYLAAASVQLGADGGMGYQYEGKSYVGTFKHAEPVNSCTECHDPHSLHTKEVEGSDANLCTTCHSDVQSYQDYKKISMSKVDYDGDGTTESTFDEIEGMRQVLIKALQGYANEKSGVGFIFEPKVYPYAFIDTNGDGEVSEGEAIYPNQFKAFTPRMLKAAYNLMFVTKEPAAYVHNPEYVLQLMYDSIEDLSQFSGVTTEGLVRP
ncbi:MAG TPA: polyheme membrane-associated cytochrome C [Anaerolineaceae bacterium]|nr:polyheme membrane-associated cytochrome C [Anaerolineaceae bacterium]